MVRQYSVVQRRLFHEVALPVVQASPMHIRHTRQAAGNPPCRQQSSCYISKGHMSTLIPIGLAVTALLLLGYIVGTEMCLPAARRALHTGDMELWRLACRLVAAGEWTIIAVCASFLVLAEQAWYLFTVTQAAQLPGMAAAGLITGLVLWEIAGRFQKRYARIMSVSLDLVLPATGRQRELYERLQQKLETGSVAEQRQVLQTLVVKPDVRVD